MRRLLFKSVEPDRIILADRARDTGHWATAARYYREALDRNPDNAPIWVQYGHALKEQGLHQRAEEAYRRSLALDDAVADTHLQLGHVLKLQGSRYDAAEAYLEAYQLDPKSPFAAAELQTLWPGVADSASKVEEFDVDPRFVEAVYGSSARGQDRLNPSSGPRGEAPGLRYRNCAHLLSWHWLTFDLVEIFDFLYYFHVNPLVARDLKTPNRYRCLVHFCEVGIGQLLPCNETYRFDPDFYVDTYLDGTAVSPRAAYRQWLNAGYRAGWHPNRQNWIKSVLDIDPTSLEKIDLPLYLTSSDSDKRAKWTDLFMQFIDDGVVHLQSHLPVTEQTADLFVAIGDRFAGKGKDDEALAIYERVLYIVPNHKRAIRHRADSLIRKGSVLEALHIHNDLVLRGEHEIWSYLIRAACYERLGDFFNSVKSLHRGIRRHPGNVELRRRFEAAAEQLILCEWHRQAFPMGMLGRFDEARERLSSASETLSSLILSKECLPRRQIRSIAIVTVEVSLQCRLYRIDQKIEQLQTIGYSVIAYKEDEIDQYLANIYKFDAVIFYRLPGLARLIFAINKSKELGITTFYEVDDLVFTTDFPDSFESYGGLINMEEYAGLKLGVPLYRNAIASCDYAIASTTPLAAELFKVVSTRKAFVHRNSFGRLHQLLAENEPKPHHNNNRVVIFYGSGTKAHKEDFQQLVEPALVEIVRRHGQRVTIILAGYIVLSARLQGIRNNLRIVEINWDIEQYWALLQSADINIAVLKPSLMSDCKSEIKWMEAAMFGIPSVVSGTSTYREVIEPGVTGLICDTVEEWISALDLLVRDSALRQRMGREAWRRIRQNYSIEAAAQNLVQIFDECSPLPELPAKPIVLIVNVFYPPQAIGGATRVVHDNVRHLSTAYEKDFRIEVFTTTHGGERDYETSSYVQDGVRVTALDRRTDPDVESAVVDNRTGQLFGAFLDEIRPSLIHFHCIQRLTASVVSAAEERGIPYLITAHDAWWISSHQFAVDEYGELALYDYANPLSVIPDLGKPAYDRMKQLRQPLFAATNVLAVSETFADLYRRCGVPNVLTVENGVSHFPEPKRTQSTDGRVRLAFIGGIHRIKGYDLIKYAALSTRFKHLNLLVMDNRLQFGQSRRESWNEMPVEFFAKVPEDQVVDLYAKIDVLLAPSIWPESFGLVTREALHFGCWVVASDRGSIGSCVTEDVNGHIIDVSDASDLIRVLTVIDENPQRYMTRPPAPAEFRKASEQGEELARIYKSLIASPAKGRAEATRID